MFAIAILLAAMQVTRAEASAACTAAGTVAVTGVVSDDVSKRRVASSQIMIVPARPDLRPLRGVSDSAGAFAICVPFEAFPALVYAVAGERISKGVAVRDVASAALPVGLGVLPGSPVRVTGRVYDSDSGKGIGGATVSLGQFFRYLTDRSGRFQFVALPGGDYVLSAQHVAYQTAADTMSLNPGSNLDVSVPLAQAVVDVAPIVVTLRSKGLEQVGFYERQRTGFGSYLTRKEIDQLRGIALPSDLLRGFNGVHLARRPNGRGYRVVGRNQCPYRYYVDGVRIGSNFEFDDLEWHWIDALEVYNGLGQVPARFAEADPMNVRSCGVVVVWTRQVAR